MFLCNYAGVTTIRPFTPRLCSVCFADWLMLRIMVVSIPITQSCFKYFLQNFSAYFNNRYFGTNTSVFMSVYVLVCLTGSSVRVCVPEQGYLVVNKEEIVSGTCREDSVTLRLSSLLVYTIKCIVFVCLSF